MGGNQGCLDGGKLRLSLKVGCPSHGRKCPDRDKRDMKELPDWVRIPLGMAPRSIERFKSGRNVPPCVMKKIVEMIERVTTGGEHSQLTRGKSRHQIHQKGSRGAFEGLPGHTGGFCQGDGH